MTHDNPDWIVISFSIFNTLRLASYLPQIAAVARDHNGATAISLTCWIIWVGANGTTGLYAWLKLSDLSLATISALNCACCAVVVALAVYKRTQFFTAQPTNPRRPRAQTRWPASPNAQALGSDRIVTVSTAS